jgi:hypothetical protein
MLHLSSLKVILLKSCSTLSTVSILLRQISFLASLSSSTEHLTTYHRIPIQNPQALNQKVVCSWLSALCKIKTSNFITPQVLLKHFQSWAVSLQSLRPASSSISCTRDGLTLKSIIKSHKVMSHKKMTVWHLRKLKLCIPLKTLTSCYAE